MNIKQNVKMKIKSNNLQAAFDKNKKLVIFDYELYSNSFITQLFTLNKLKIVLFNENNNNN